MNDMNIVNCELTICRETGTSIMKSQLSINNFIIKLKEWLNLFDIYAFLNSDEIIVKHRNDESVSCHLKIFYPFDFCVSDKYSPNILNGNIDWNNIVRSDIISQGICSPEYILGNRTINSSIVKSKVPFDLASLLILLKQREANITLPEYHRVTNSKSTDNQIVTDRYNRNGKLVSLVSNASTFNFSIRIIDNNVQECVDNDVLVGCPRTFTITDTNGNLSTNWKNFKYIPCDGDKELLSDIISFFDGVLSFSEFVNSEKSQCFYSEWFYKIKLMINRLVQERKYLNNIISKHKKLLNNASVYEKNNIIEEVNQINEIDEVKKIDNKVESKKVLCFECVIEEPIISFSYINENQNPSDVINDCCAELEGLNSTLEFYRFIARMIECSWCKLNPYDENMNPSAFKKYDRSDILWESDLFKFPGKRIQWFKCNLLSIKKSLYCRYFYKTIKQKQTDED